MAENLVTENNNPTEGNPAAAPEKTFTQAEVDAITGRRLARAMKDMPGEAELTEFRTWKEGQKTEKERWETLTKERDDSRTELKAALEKLETYERERVLTKLGVPAEDVDYYAFKIGQQVTETTTFEEAAKQFLQERFGSLPGMAKPKVDFSAPLSGAGPTKTASETMNALIRGARK